MATSYFKTKHERLERERVDTILNHARDGWLQYNEIVRGMFGPDCLIDEVAFLFTSERAVASMVKHFVGREGYELFNVASDKVDTRPIPSQYEVNYWFVRTPFEYRLELMNVAAGYSPIHSAIQMVPDDDFVGMAGIHVSFKLPDSEAYASANATLLREGWECAQKCDSTYGKFSYWNNPDLDGWFLKPRVNLRDGS